MSTFSIRYINHGYSMPFVGTFAACKDAAKKAGFDVAIDLVGVGCMAGWSVLRGWAYFMEVR